METENRRFTILSFFIFSALCGYVFYLALSLIADLFKFGGSNVLWGYPWAIVGGAIATIVGLILFIALSVNKTALDFIDDVFAELRKTTWPTPKETSASTVVVTIMVGIATLMLFVMDWIWGIVFRILL